MSLNNIIDPMYYSLVKSSIASLMASERNNQLQKLSDAGYDEDDIANNYDFNVFKDLYRFPDASELPMINIYNDNGSFDSNKSYIDSKWHVYRLAVDCYSVSTAEEDDLSVGADQLAAERLDYLWAQAFKTLNCEANFHKGLRDIIRGARFLSWEQKLVKVGSAESAESILAIQAVLELQFEEPTEITTGEQLELLVASLEIDDEYIDPFVRVQLTS